jgi:hypothetical protein
MKLFSRYHQITDPEDVMTLLYEFDTKEEVNKSKLLHDPQRTTCFMSSGKYYVGGNFENREDEIAFDVHGMDESCVIAIRKSSEVSLKTKLSKINGDAWPNRPIDMFENWLAKHGFRFREVRKDEYDKVMRSEIIEVDLRTVHNI